MPEVVILPTQSKPEGSYNSQKYGFHLNRTIICLFYYIIIITLSYIEDLERQLHDFFLASEK